MTSTNTINRNNIEQQTWQWLDNVVIGLNLCPFAKKPRTQKQIRLVISDHNSLVNVADDFATELEFLSKTPANETDTTMFVIPHLLEDFYVYLDFLESANNANHDLGFEGKFQLASFHPDYQFEDAEPEDRANYTNRAPFPIIHIIREDSMTRVLKQYPNPELIPERNIEAMDNLSDDMIKTMFPHVVSD